MVHTKPVELPGRGERFRNLDELKAVVRRQAEVEWQSFTGHTWTESDEVRLRWFDKRAKALKSAGRTRGEYLAIVQELVSVAERVRKFVVDKRQKRKPAGVLDEVYELLGGEAWQRLEAGLLAIEAQEKAQRKQLRQLTGRFALVWLCVEGHFPTIPRDATIRQLAIASLLTGNWPNVGATHLARNGATVAEVIEAEERAIGEARFRCTGIRDTSLVNTTKRRSLHK